MSSTSLVSDQKQTHDERKRLVVLVDDDRNLCDLVERVIVSWCSTTARASWRLSVR